jgi:plastocyanin
VSRRVLSVALVLGLALTACGGGSPQAQTVSTSFVPQTVDFLDDVGRGVSLALDKDGNPHLAYIGLVEQLEPGEIPPARPATAPALPAVLTASQKEGIFSHGFVVQTDISSSTPKNVPVDAASTTGIAVASTGALDVVWNQFPGIYFATAPTDTAPFGDPQTVTGGYGFSPAVAVNSKGNPWVAWVQQDSSTGELTVQVATLQGKKWTPEQVADLGTCSAASCSTVRIGLVVANDQPMVAYTDTAGSVFVATHNGPSASGQAQTGTTPSWTPETVASNANALGVSLGVATGGSIHVAYATTTGDVKEADATSPTASWNVSTVGSYTPPKARPSPLPSPSPSPSPSASGASPSASPSASAASTAPPAPQAGTAVGVDPKKGTTYVAWTDPGARVVKLASSSGGGSFDDIATPGTDEGEFPSLAVSDTGKASLAWYNADAQDLELGTYPEKLGAIALPAPSTPASLPQGAGGGPKCPKDQVEIIAPVGAGGAGFQTTNVTAARGNFTICFDNEDTTGHNVAIFKDQATAESGGQPLAQDEVFSGPKIDSFDVSGLSKGDYFFHCIVHPTTMTGTLTVK